MQLSHLTKPKSSHTAWLLAVVLFFSGLSFSSSSSAYARERQVKARTELVVSTKNRSGKTSSPKHHPTHTTETPRTNFIHCIEFHSTLSAIQLKHVTKTHLHFSPILKKASFFPIARVSNACATTR
jgi:hypothetical protein